MLAVPADNMDAASIAGSEEPEDVDFRKKIKYGSRIQVCPKLIFFFLRCK